MPLCETQEFCEWVRRAQLELLCECALTFRETRMECLSSPFVDPQIEALARSSRLAVTDLMARLRNPHGQ